MMVNLELTSTAVEHIIILLKADRTAFTLSGIVLNDIEEQYEKYNK